VPKVITGEVEVVTNGMEVTTNEVKVVTNSLFLDPNEAVLLKLKKEGNVQTFLLSV
jgi:hypothetical protein